MPSVNKLFAQYKSGGFEVLLVDFRESPALVKRTARERGYVAPVPLDRSGEVTGKDYGVWGPPTSYCVNRNGQLVGRVNGSRPWDNPAGRRFIEALLGTPAKP